jgi:PDZ domain-containing protein
MDTAEPTVLPPYPPSGGDEGPPGAPPDESVGPQRWWTRRRAVAAVISLSLLTAAALIVFLWKLDYYTLSPGSARETAPFIQIEGAPTFPDQEGMVDYLTVSVKQATPADAFLAWIDPAIDIVDAELVLGSQTPSENRELNLQLMASSKDSATYQALQRLGYEIPISGTGAVIASVAADVPAAAVLERGDTVVSVDGRPVAVSQDLSGQVAALPPGAVIELGVQPFEGGDTRVVSVELVVRPDDPTRSMIGVSTFTRDLTFDFPVQVTIDSGQVGGPSAGLAFTLGILDALTPESITGGARVATTGTMELDGTVGPVGGVHQKVVAASREGVDLMLVPSAELEEARRYGGDLRIEPVDDLDDALAVLATMGGGDAVLPAPTEAVPVG